MTKLTAMIWLLFSIGAPTSAANGRSSPLDDRFETTRLLCSTLPGSSSSQVPSDGFLCTRIDEPFGAALGDHSRNRNSGASSTFNCVIFDDVGAKFTPNGITEEEDKPTSISSLFHVGRHRRDSPEKKEGDNGTASRDSKGKISANPGTRRLELKSLNVVPTTIRAIVIPDSDVSDEEYLAAARRRTTSSRPALQQRGVGSVSITPKDDGQVSPSPADLGGDDASPSQEHRLSSRADVVLGDGGGVKTASAESVDFDQSIVPTVEPLGVALLNSVQAWYVVSLVLASFFVVSVIVNVILCCAFKRKFSPSRRGGHSSSDCSSASAVSPSGSSVSAPKLRMGAGTVGGPAAVYATSSNDFLVVQEIDDVEARRLERRGAAKGARQALTQGKDRWNRFFSAAGGRRGAAARTKETVIEYDNRSQLSQFFHWARSSRF